MQIFFYWLVLCLCFGTAEASDLRFGIAIVQDLKVFSSPEGEYHKDHSFTMPILTPHEIIDEKKTGSELWYKIHSEDGLRVGWVPANLVYVWNSRHALRPELSSLVGGYLPAYCSEEELNDTLLGKNSPCMRFGVDILSREGERAPFPVLDVKQIRMPDGRINNYMHVLVPTLYSNIAELKPLTDKKTKDVLDLAGTYEVIILIDATGSMADEIAAAAEALTEQVEAISSTKDVQADFMIIAYRDTDGATSDCPAMEATLKGGKPAFVNSKEALSFLNYLKDRACEGGDREEALWDGIYLLKNIKLTPGAKRNLIVAGDAPAHNYTRGGRFLGTEVPSGLSATEVFQEVALVLGQSTQFLGYIVSDGVYSSLEQLQTHIPFTRSEIKSISTSSDITSTMSEDIETGIKRAEGDVKGSLECLNSIRYDEKDFEVGIFCGEVEDAAFSSRIRDLALKSDDIVIKDMWVPQSDLLYDVALLSRVEAQQTSSVMAELGAQFEEDGTMCQTKGLEAWMSVSNVLLPGKSYEGSGGGIIFDQPSISESLHEHWGLQVRNGRSILKLQPSDLQRLGEVDCRKLGQRLTQSSQLTSLVLGEYPDMAFIWLPLSSLP